MISLLGQVVLECALALAVVGAISAFLGERLGRVRWDRRAAVAVFVLVAFAVVLMEWALIGHDFSVKYVADNGSRDTPLYYTVISLWGALEGSILFWAFLLSAYTMAFLKWSSSGALQRRAVGVLLGVSSFFLFVIAFPGNPFVALAHPPVDGAGPNPLLQNNWIMGLHPPLLYLGYVGLTVPFAIAISSLLGGIPDAAAFRLMRRWALIAWVFLTLGIVGGMWWSYAVLGWGGYWSWDPVENASVMPWLVTTAYLHSLQVQERRQMLKTWTISLLLSAWLLSVLGTFLTRSGTMASVHSFTQSAIGPVFLVFFAGVVVSSVVLVAMRASLLSAPAALDAVICRETAFLFNNLLFVAVTFTILLGTLFPILVEISGGGQISVAAPYFNHVAVPIGFAVLFLMGIGPVLPWGASRAEEVQYRLLGPVAIGVVTVFLLMFAGVRGVGSLVTFGTVAFVLAVSIGRVVADVRVRRAHSSETWQAAGGRVVAANPRRYGGYLAHIGVLLVVAGIAASQAYEVREFVSLAPGAAMHIDGYTVKYRGWRPIPGPGSNQMTVSARVDVSRAGQSLGSLEPAQKYYAGTGNPPVVTPAIREQPLDLLGGILAGRNPLAALAEIFHGRNPVEDIYVTLEGTGQRPNQPVSMQVIVDPMVGMIWLGGAVMGLGGVLALLPARRRRSVAARARESVRLQPEEVTA